MVCAKPLTRLAEFTLSPFAALRAVRGGRANGLATLSPERGEGCNPMWSDFSTKASLLTA